MKSCMLIGLPLLALVCAVTASPKANALELNFGIGVGDRHHHREAPVVYRTADPVYQTWYPAQTTTTTVYTAPTTTTVYVAPTTTTTYSTEPVYEYQTGSVEYNTWYSDTSHRRDWHHGRWHDGHGH